MHLKDKLLKSIKESFNIDDFGNDIIATPVTKHSVSKHSKIYDKVAAMASRYTMENNAHNRRFVYKRLDDDTLDLLETIIYHRDLIDDETIDFITNNGVLDFVDGFLEYQMQCCINVMSGKGVKTIKQDEIYEITDERLVRFKENYIDTIRDDNDRFYGYFHLGEDIRKMDATWLLRFIIEHNPYNLNLKWISIDDFNDDIMSQIRLDDLNLKLRLWSVVYTSLHNLDISANDDQFYEEVVSATTEKTSPLYACYFVRDKKELMDIAYNGILYGNTRWLQNLNWIDVREVTDMSDLFSDMSYGSCFAGDISLWDVHNVVNMESMFAGSEFDGDISNWNVSKDCYINDMFSYSAMHKCHRPKCPRNRKIDEGFDISDMGNEIDATIKKKQNVAKTSKNYKTVRDFINRGYDLDNP